MLSKRVEELLKSRVSYPLAREYGAEVAKATNLASNESPFGPSPRVLRTLKLGLDRVGSYPDPRAGELKRSIARYVGSDASCVALGNGSDELVDLICKAFLDPGDEALIPIPTFSMYEIACGVNGGKPRFVELPNFEWRAAELVRALTEAKLAFIGRPNNPTGNGIDAKGLGEMLATGKLVVVDEAYSEFAGYSVVGQTKRRKNLLLLRTFSKAFGLAGLRIGYAIGDPELVGVLERIRGPFDLNALAQIAAVEALRDKRHLRKVVAAARRGRAYLERELSELGMRVLPSDANFLMADVSPSGADAPTLCEFLARRGILIRDLSGFRGAGPNWVRITVGTDRQNEKFVRALKKFQGRKKCA